MEYDNDKPRKPLYKIEIFYWVLLAIINPLINSLTIFLYDATIWAVLFLVSLIVLPAYFFYSGWIASKFLFQKQYSYFVFTSFSFLITIQLLLFFIYSLILKFSLSPAEQLYFSFSYSTIIRESLWCIINMSLATGIFYIKKALDENELLVNLEKENTSFKLKYLRSQLNPHFLFNTLNSIYSLSLQKSDKTPEVVVRLADLMRYLIYECNEEKVLLTKEIEFIQNYIEIEKLRYKADVRFTLEGSAEGIMIEPFLFVSFIENGFTHALNNSYSNPFIYITIKVMAQQIELSVVNNTSTDIETQAKRIHGSGIKNSKSLLELLYHNSYALNIISTEKKEQRKSELRIKNARKRLESLYPDSHTLDVILSNNAFTVSLIIKQDLLDKVHYS